MFNVGKIPVFDEGKQTLVTTKYGGIQENNKHIWNPHMMLNTIVSNFFRFEDDLAEKRPYKHRGKIIGKI